MRLTKAQIARIQALETAEGALTAHRLLEDAKRPKSPLHKLFDWDVKHAAERWWLHQARLIIGAVTIQVTTETAVIKAPCYVIDTTAEGGGYRSTVRLRQDPTGARETLIASLEVASGHLRRCYVLASALGLSNEIDQLLLQMTGLVRRLSNAA